MTSARPIDRRPERPAAGRSLSLAAVLAAVTGASLAQELDVPYVETPDKVVEIMMDVADIGRGDYVVDLGTGDGRLVVAAAKRGATGLGVDLDPERVQEARDNALTARVSGRVLFLEQDLFDTNISNASVVLLFLNSEVNLRLRPVLLAMLEPGTRVVSHNFDMAEWGPDVHRQYLRESNDSYYMHDVYSWIVPADAAGSWSGRVGNEEFRMTLQQEFQRVSPAVTLDKQPMTISEAALHGRRLNVIALDPKDGAEYLFNGNIAGDRISGIVQVRAQERRAVEPWKAQRD